MAEDNADGVRQLKRHFGARLDEGALLAVLEMFGGSVDEAKQFLEAEEGDEDAYDAYQLAQNEGGIPADYPPTSLQQQLERGGGYRGGRGRGGRRGGPDRRHDMRTAEGRAAAAEERARQREEARRLEEAKPIDERLRRLFLQEEGTLREHHTLQTSHYERYVATLLLLLKSQAVISKSARPRVLGACWARGDRELPLFLLTDRRAKDSFALPHVLGALKLLDTGRQLRAINKQIKRLEAQGTAKPRTIKRLREKTKGFIEGDDPLGAVSGSLARHIREKWISEVSENELLYYALAMPTQPWEELIDLLHVKPSDFKLDWFADFVCGHDPPRDSVLALCQGAIEGTSGSNAPPHAQLCQLIAEQGVELPYSFLRKHVKPPQLSEAARVKIATYESVDKVLWFHEELTCAAVDALLLERLRAGEQVTFGYGKLMERLMYLMALGSGTDTDNENIAEDSVVSLLLKSAEARLKVIQLSLEGPVVVLGDASYSMDVAIRTSTVIGSVLAALSGADLLFFTDEVVRPPTVPRSAAEVLEVSSRVRADGLTAPAAAMWGYLQRRERVKQFVVVTDEVENNKFKAPDGNEYYFPDLYQKYVTDVAPECKIAFVSFLDSPSDRMGRMASALEVMGIQALVFKLDSRRPDLTKLDQILAALQAQTDFFPRCVDAACTQAGPEELQARIQQLQLQETGQQQEAESSAPVKGSGKREASEAWGGSARGGALAGTRAHVDALPRETRLAMIDVISESLDEAILGEAARAVAARVSIAPQVGEGASAASAGTGAADVDMLSSSSGVAPPPEEKRLKVDKDSGPAVPAPAGTTGRECIICLEKPMNTVLLECGHAQFCQECAEKVVAEHQPCPVCRESVTRCKRIFTE